MNGLFRNLMFSLPKMNSGSGRMMYLNMLWWIVNTSTEFFQENDLAECQQQYLHHFTGYCVHHIFEPMTLHFGWSLKRMSSNNNNNNNN
jgi:hypothetical protein